LEKGIHASQQTSLVLTAAMSRSEGKTQGLNVAIRTRPLNEREMRAGQTSSWQIGNNVITQMDQATREPIAGTGLAFGN
jgi:hypothetical protein